MKIKIESDVFDIVERIKDLDESYFIIYDTLKNRIEVHNSKQKNSFCFVSKFDNVCKGVLDEVVASSVANIDKIINEIDNNNINMERCNQQKINDVSDYKLREIFNFYNNSSKEYSSDVAFSTIWR